jgi:penicillin-binding protein 1A
LSLGLGTGEVFPVELVNAYTTIAAQGFYTPPLMVLRVRDRKGAVLEEHPPVLAPRPLAAPVPAPAPQAVAGSEPALPDGGAGGAEPGAAPVPAPTPVVESAIPASGMQPEVAFVLSSMMRAVIENGTGVAAKALGRPAAGKTGTTQNQKDAWFVGFTPDLVAGVWVGFDDEKYQLGSRGTGAGAALPAWLAFMKAATSSRPVVEFQAPSNVEFARIDPATGMLARDVAPGAGQEMPFFSFVAGTAPTQSAPEPGSMPQSFFQDDH